MSEDDSLFLDARRFLDAAVNAQSLLDSTQIELRARVVQVQDALKHFAARTGDPRPGGRGETISPLARDFRAALDQRTKAWEQQLLESISNTDFVDKFDRSLIVLVYGKVNSGKSTLGNTLAGVPFQRLKGYPYAGHSPVFERHDAVAGVQRIEVLSDGPATDAAATDTKGFATDATECTSSIQSFRLGGFAWVDTPGIHSMTLENQALARKYLESAELVVFVTASGAPMRSSDVQELRELLHQRKPVLLVVTRFDVAEEDVDAQGELVRVYAPKPKESMDAQRRWIESQVHQHSLSCVLADRDYFFVSAHIAQQAATTDNVALFVDSGIPNLFRGLTRVLERDAVALKAQAPKMRFKRLLDDICGDGWSRATCNQARTLEGLSGESAAMRTRIEESRAQLRNLAPTIITRLRSKAIPELCQIVESEKDAQNVKGLARTSIAERAAEAVSGAFRVIAAEEVLRVVADFEEGVASGLGDGFKFSPHSVEDRMRKQYVDGMGGPAGAAAGAMVAGGAVLALELALGPPGWALAIVSLVGGSLLGAAGTAIGKKVGGRKAVMVKAGDNAAEVAESLMRELDVGVVGATDRYISSVDQRYFAPALAWVDERDCDIDRLKRRLDELRFDEGE